MCFPKLRKFANLKCSQILNLSAFDKDLRAEVAFADGLYNPATTKRDLHLA